MKPKNNFDVIVVGSGIAGTYLVNLLAPHRRVALVSKRSFPNSNSYYAQGGIAAVLDNKTDSFDKHIQDTMVAGAQLNNLTAVRTLVREAPAQIQQLIDWGVQFDQANHGLDLTREGGHSNRRIVHVRDLTGRAVELTLLRRLRKFSNITYFEHHLGLDLAPLPPKGGRIKSRASGITLLNHKTNQVKTIYAPVVVLATGGCGQVYQYTTNPGVATGDGMAMAARAGVKLVDMEFIQFHPTVLNVPHRPHFLLSESLRGEGAILRNSKRQRFMKRYDKRAELAPRDIVSRSIVTELQYGPVYLDMTHKSKAYLQERFPYLYTHLQKFDLYLDRDLIPVAPAAHYLCGGIKTDLVGRTNLPGLYAIGEVARTGVQGANRLASNSLLECLVFAQRASTMILRQSIKKRHFSTTIQPLISRRRVNVTRLKRVQVLRKKIRKIMWQQAGIIRSRHGLTLALTELYSIQQELIQLQRHSTNLYLEETVNMSQVAIAIVQAALARPISIGSHYLV